MNRKELGFKIVPNIGLRKEYKKIEIEELENKEMDYLADIIELESFIEVSENKEA